MSCEHIYIDDEKTQLATNHQLIARIVKIARLMGYEPYTAQEARVVLGVGDRA